MSRWSDAAALDCLLLEEQSLTWCVLWLDVGPNPVRLPTEAVLLKYAWR